MMELSLNRVDYCQVGITSPKCMAILPNKGAAQRAAICDHNGVMQLFSIKKREPQIVFKTQPGPKFTRLELGGPVGAPREKIFVTAGAEVKGFSKKGKQFLGFDTNLTEHIQSMYIEGAELFACGSYVFNHYKDCQDVNHYLASDQINDVLCLPSDKTGGAIVPILACQDRVLRILQGSELVYEVELPGPPTTLSLYGDGGVAGDEVLYGTSDGRVGLAVLNAEQPAHRWVIDNLTNNGGVQCLDNYDITGDGVLDLIVGRDDGTVEVYGYDENDEPKKRFSSSCGESVTTVKGGRLGSIDYDEILCTTYAGWVYGLSTEHQDKQVGLSSHAPVSRETEDRINKMKQEVEDLGQKTAKERDKFQALSTNAKAVSAVPQFHVNDKWVLNREDASYMLSLELQVAIDNVLVQSDVPIDLIDVDKNSAVISYSVCDPEDGNFLLATYRCQANTTRLELKVRTIEGQYGTLMAYVTPRMQPKICQVRHYPIKPLSLHQRIHQLDNQRPFNSLTLAGQFSLAEVHSWMVYCLPELPDRCPPGDEVDFQFMSTFLETQLDCNYRKGLAVFRSDNISTISILKDVLSKEATKKKIRLDISYEVHDESIPHVLALIDPRLQYQLLLAKKVQLIDALKELSVHENDTSFLSPEYQQILSDAKLIQDEYKRQPCHLQRLYGMITDLYIDKYKFKGQNVKSRVPQLVELLDDYSLEALVEFFKS